MCFAQESTTIWAWPKSRYGRPHTGNLLPCQACVCSIYCVTSSLAAAHVSATQAHFLATLKLPPLDWECRQGSVGAAGMWRHAAPHTGAGGTFFSGSAASQAMASMDRDKWYGKETLTSSLKILDAQTHKGRG